MTPDNTASANPRTADNMNRRRFMAGTGAAAVSLSVVRPELAFGTSAHSKVRMGIVGCGGRGTWIAGLFRRHGGYHIVAAADYFQDRVDKLGEQFKIPPQRRFPGLSGYRRMLELKLDALVIESPPYFHPEQAAAGVDAGCHVYLAKPIAVDPPGCRTVLDSGRKATSKGLCFLVDFQTRADAFFKEAIQRVHAGAIGRFAFGEASYHASNPWRRQVAPLRKAPNDPETRLRAWGLDRALSGDIITEQNIHTLDVASWIMNQPPVCAYGTGGRKVRDVGTCWDTFSVVFKYADDVGITFSSRQFDGHGSKPEGIRNRMFGAQGVLETKYGGPVLIRGENAYRGGSSPRIYEQGAVHNIATFHANIQKGDHANPTVPESVRSNLVTILGRTAAYEGRVVQWREITRSQQKLVADLRGLKD